MFLVIRFWPREIKVSGQLHIDLLVMGRLGRSDLEKFLLGNVAERVVLQSAIPVLLIKGDRF
jgi:nucleotide-binding universal stress UspA family protein